MCMHMSISSIRGWCACAYASHNTLSMQCTCAMCKGAGLGTKALG